jgi:hypothetical protein
MADLYIFKGQEGEALQICINLLCESSGDSPEEVINKIKAQMPQSTLTEEDIENRNYTYVAVTRKSSNGDDIVFEKFLVSDPHKERAHVLADQYVKQQGWIVVVDKDEFSSKCKCCRKFHFYPRNYVVTARRLWQEGKYL